MVASSIEPYRDQIGECNRGFPIKKTDDSYQEGILLDLDYWGVLPRCILNVSFRDLYVVNVSILYVY